MRWNIETRPIVAPRRRYFLRELFGLMEAVAAVLIFLSLIGDNWIGVVGEVVSEQLTFVLGRQIAFVLPVMLMINAGQLLFGRAPMLNQLWSVVRGFGGLVLLISTCGIVTLHLELAGRTEPERLFRAGGIVGAFLVDSAGLNLRHAFGRVGGLIVLYGCALTGCLLFTETLFRDAGLAMLRGLGSVIYPKALIEKLSQIRRPQVPGFARRGRAARDEDRYYEDSRIREDDYAYAAPPPARRSESRQVLRIERNPEPTIIGKVGRSIAGTVMLPVSLVSKAGQLVRFNSKKQTHGRVLGNAPISNLEPYSEEGYAAPPAIRKRELAGLRQDRSWAPRVSDSRGLIVPDGYSPEPVRHHEGEWEEDVWVESNENDYDSSDYDHLRHDDNVHAIDAEPWTEDSSERASSFTGHGELIRRDRIEIPAAPEVADAEAAEEFLAARGTRLPNRVSVHTSWEQPEAAPPSSPPPDRVERVERIETHDRKEHFERAERVERTEHVRYIETHERADRSQPVERIERVDRAERIEHAERAERLERMERAERSASLDRAERAERMERTERRERDDRAERVERAERIESSEPRDRHESPRRLDEAADEPRAVRNQQDLREFGASMSLADEQVARPSSRDEDDHAEEMDRIFRLKRRKPEPEAKPADTKQRIRSLGNEQQEFDFKRESGPPREYKLPGMDLLQQPPRLQYKMTEEEAERLCRKIEETLAQFKVEVEVVEVVQGPTITRFALHIAPGIRVNKILQLENDLALALKAQHIRILAPIPGQAAVGIEVPNKKTNPVFLRDLMESESFQKSKSPLSFCLGKNIAGESVVADLAQMPHLLIAGATGAGKSVCLNTIIASLLYRNPPEKVRMIMVDPKRVELSIYQAIPHLMAPVVCEPRKAAAALAWAVEQMEKRYKLLSEIGVRNIDGYNDVVLDKEPNKKAMGRDLKYMPHMVVIIDELADLMLVAKNEVEEYVIRLAQMARAVGIHLILATQRPSVNVITGIIKANFPSRIAFKVSSKVDSRTILDCNGAETLMGRGDMLYSPGGVKPFRLQGAFMADSEVESLADYIRSQEKARYEKDDFEALPTPAQRAKAKLMESAMPHQAKIVADGDPNVGYDGDDGISLMPPTAGRVTEAYLPPADVESLTDEDLYDVALKLVFESRKASVSYIQRRLKIGYARAGRIMDMMEERGIVGPYKGSKPRDIIVDPGDYVVNDNYDEDDDDDAF